MSVADCRMLDLRVVGEPRGNLAVIEGGQDVPFEIRRVYYLYDVPGGAERGGHAHRQLQQLLIAVSGAFDVHLDDGREQRTVRLSRASEGLLLAPMTWRSIDGFSGGSICLVLASAPYDEADYLRDHDAFLAAARG